jgi:hypothetical protein
MTKEELGDLLDALESLEWESTGDMERLAILMRRWVVSVEARLPPREEEA